MPMSYQIDTDRKLLLIRGSGRLTDAEMIACVDELREDPAVRPDLQTLSDMREIEVGFTPAGVEAMVAAMRSSANPRDGVKAAIVVGSEVAFGMGRMFQLRTDEDLDPRFRVFRSMQDALEWLDVSM